MLSWVGAALRRGRLSKMENVRAQRLGAVDLDAFLGGCRIQRFREHGRIIIMGPKYGDEGTVARSVREGAP